MNKTLLFILTISTLVCEIVYSSQPLFVEGLISWRHFSSDETIQNSNQISTSSMLDSLTTDRINGLNYLNSLRNGASVISYNANSLLDTAAQNHTDYLVFHNLFGHYEDETNYPEGFTGVTPGDRITYVGYSWTSIGENISGGDQTIYEALDGLFTAIYHRFGFLDFNNNEVGIGISQDAGYIYGSAFGFDMANSGYTADTRQLNPQYILWPYSNYNNAQTSFNNSELPDPTPECPSGGITGNPISVEFNADKNSAITMNSFKLFETNGTEITNTKNLTTNLNSRQFVLFPMTSLSLDSRYRVEFNYTESSVVKNITWYFNTRRYTDKRYEVTHSNTYDVISDQSYIIHLKPNDCTVPLNSYSWNSGGAVIERLNTDLFRISVTSDTTFNFNSGSFVFTLHVAASDNAIEPSAKGFPALVPVINYLLF